MMNFIEAIRKGVKGIKTERGESFYMIVEEELIVFRDKFDNKQLGIQDITTHDVYADWEIYEEKPKEKGLSSKIFYGSNFPDVPEPAKGITEGAGDMLWVKDVKEHLNMLIACFEIEPELNHLHKAVKDKAREIFGDKLI